MRRLPLHHARTRHAAEQWLADEAALRGKHGINSSSLDIEEEPGHDRQGNPITVYVVVDVLEDYE